ncbi:hypothetical protein C1H46_028123 [Malus baccata]|uniref:Uncharacterized protein n=1 Tax=Malus baccata TaxID=106549 RepID=A0A540LJ12_MALBA|nr:hypothetical protein C1H46_028123 [Malus baccata]
MEKLGNLNPLAHELATCNRMSGDIALVRYGGNGSLRRAKKSVSYNHKHQLFVSRKVDV